jgi:thiamine biosynthesis protein ThiS
MHIVVNGESREVDDQLTAWQLIELLGLTDARLAMEVNREIVPRSTFDTRRLQPGDQVEIVRAIGGGNQDAECRQQVK